MFDDLLAANRLYAADFALRGIPARAARGFGLVTCMDSRIEPLTMLGLAPGDAKIQRNAGGRVTTDILRSLALATTMLGVTHLAVMHHSGCALANCDEESVRAAFSGDERVAAEAWTFLAMPEPDDALAVDVRAVLDCPIIRPGTHVVGWRYDVDSGLIDVIVPEATNS